MGARSGFCSRGIANICSRPGCCGTSTRSIHDTGNLSGLRTMYVTVECFYYVVFNWYSSSFQTRVYRPPNSIDASKARGRLQTRHHDLPYHSELLLHTLRRTLLSSPSKPQHHSGLLSKDQDPYRELSNETEKDGLLSNEI